MAALARMCDLARPHPGPLPRGEGELSSGFRRCERFGFSGGGWSKKRRRGEGKGDIETMGTCAGFSLSLGERAGVRASVGTHFPEPAWRGQIGSIGNSGEASCCR